MQTKNRKEKNNSLTYKIFISTFLLGLLVYFLCIVIFILNVYSRFTESSLLVLILEMSQLLFFMLFVTMIISLIIALFLAKKIVEPLNNINLESPQESLVYDELKPFIKRIAEDNYEKQQNQEFRSQFTANVSHELKTPLTSISGFAEILQQGNVDKKTTKDFASTIFTESQRMILLVNDIIKLSELDEKAINSQKETLNLREITTEVLEVLHTLASKRKITINLYGESGIINGVKSVIYEMIYNLVCNAIIYNKDNGDITIKIKEITESSNVIFSVKDSGIGIPEREQERIFERFYRIDKSRSRQNGGTGLGLSIVKHAAKYHNASVSVSSKVGEGSKFTVIFLK